MKLVPVFVFVILVIGFDFVGTESSDRLKRQSNQETTSASALRDDNKMEDSIQNLFSYQTPDLASIEKMFHTNRNSIIRTHDSRVLGAVFLNSTILNSNEECLRFCWNISNCNLAVFEGKEKGTCYLFDCGTFDNFKCRFTPHEFYTSSVLHVNRNSYLLQEWQTQANKENELTGLKSNKPNGHKSRKIVDNTKEAPVLQAEPTRASKCRHYQFECRNSSECIAIYNVCDGIPQCSDGSDEAVELECRKSRLNLATKSPATINKTPENSKIDLSSFTEHQVKPVASFIPSSYGDSNAKMPEDWNSVINANKLLNPSNYYNYPKSVNDKLTEENNVYKGNGQMNVDYNGYVPPSWNQFIAPNELINKQADKLINYGTEQQDRYGNVLKDQSVYSWPSFTFPQSEQQSRSLLNRQLDVGYNVPPINYENRVEYPQTLITKQNAPIVPNNYPSDSMTIPKAEVSNIATTQASLPNIPSAKKVNYSHVGDSKAKVETGHANVVAMSFLHDPANQSGRETNSAVIALTLGLFITTVLIFLVGCRMKSFKKRLARRGRSLAHDADYLINGMHL